MILLTLGTNRYPFTRLAAAVDRALTALVSKELLVVQSGNTPYEFRYPNRKIRREIPYQELRRYFRGARLIIGHAGAGSILMALSDGSGPYFAVPRLNKLGEHIDDHQVGFFRYARSSGLVSGPSRGNLTQSLSAFLKNPPPHRGHTNNRKRLLISALTSFADDVCPTHHR